MMKWQISITWLVPHYVNEYGVDDDVLLRILSLRSYLFAAPSISQEILLHTDFRGRKGCHGFYQFLLFVEVWV